MHYTSTVNYQAIYRHDQTIKVRFGTIKVLIPVADLDTG